MSYENIDDPFISNHSANSSFSEASSGTWDSGTNCTPVSTPRRGSPHSSNRAGSTFSAPTPVCTPSRYGSDNGFYAMNALTQQMLSGYQHPMMFANTQIAMDTPVSLADSQLNYGPCLDTPMYISSSNGLPLGTPLLEPEVYSPSSGQNCLTPPASNCVVPSQTFMDSYDLQSPTKSMQITLDYDNGLVQTQDEYDSNFSMDGSSLDSLGYIGSDFTASLSPAQCHGPDGEQTMLQSSVQGCDQEQVRRVDDLKAKVKKSRRNNKRETRLRSSKTSLQLGDSITREPPAQNLCNYRGCNKAFQRAEHLKRHQMIHAPAQPITECEFCRKPFKKYRHDNFKAHVLLHTKLDKNGKRTKYDPDAAAVVQAMNTRPRKSDSPTRVKKEGSNVQHIVRTRVQGY